MTPERFARLEELFAGATELEGAERARFVEEATAGDATLRTELERLLAADEASGDSLGGAISFLAATPAEDEPAPDWTGRRIGAYRIEREIGRGGMSVVFEGVREGDFSQRVAIKLSTLALFSADLRERFRQERRILAQLEHPNIARLIDGGTTDDGVLYLVTEFCEGAPLGQQGRLGERAACELFLKICGAVEFAHQNLVVHRDLKPANILVDGNGTPKLIDFGIAKLLAPEAATTLTSLRPGTPKYAAPEQILGLPITTRTDIYQLGLVFREMLAEGLRGDLAVIVATALQEDPARRYGTVAALMDDVRAHLNGRPIAARADSVAYRARLFLRRHWLASAAGAVVVVSLAAGVAATLYQARIAERRFTQVRGIARALMYDVQGAIQALPASLEAQQVVVRTALAYLNGLAAEAGGDPALQLEIASGYSRIGGIQARMVGPSLDERKAGQESYERAAGILESLHAARPGDAAVAAELTDVYAGLLEIDMRSGRSEKGAERAARAIAVGERALAENAGHAELTRRVANAYVLYNRDVAGRAKVDLTQLRKPVELLEPLVAKAPGDAGLREELANAYAAGVAALFNGRRTEEARVMGEKALALREQAVASQPESAVARRLLMLAYAALGDIHWGLPASLGKREVAIGYYEKMLGPAEWLREREPAKRGTRTDFAMTRMRYASALPAGSARAIPMLREAVETMEGILREDPKNFGVGRQLIDLYLRLAGRYGEAGDRGAAVRCLRQGWELGERMANADAKNLGARTWGLRAALALGRALAAGGQRGDALALIPKAEQRAAEAVALDPSSAGGGTWPEQVAAWRGELEKGR
jgi:tetratricopeptide (TPR) repeat protein